MIRGRHGLLVPGISTLIMLLVLIGLGTWQLRRLAWKQEVLSQIAHAEQSEPIPLPADPVPFVKVVVSGHLRSDLAAKYGAEVREVGGGTDMGTHLIVPLERDTGPDILVDRGWVPQDRATPIEQPVGTVSVVGFVRPADQPGWFTPADDPVDRQFYTLNPAAIGAALGLTRLAPFTLIAMAPEGPMGLWPAPAHRLPRLPNNHLAYAVTWYGLALALVAVFIVWARQNLKK